MGRRKQKGRLVSIMAALGLAAVLLAPAVQVGAEGPIWSPPVGQASHPARATSDDIRPAVVSDRGHVYILHARQQGTPKPDTVFFTPNESGGWQTSQLSTAGPIGSSLDDRVSLAVDRSTGRLYAAWVSAVSTDPNVDKGYAVTIAMRDPASHTWSAPQAVYANTMANDHAVTNSPASIVAAHGKAYVSFIGAIAGATCSSRSFGDVLVGTYDGSAWTTPQNLTSCVKIGQTFGGPKLALDQGGHLYMVANNDAGVRWDLWYADMTSGSWSAPLQLTHSRIGTYSGGLLEHYDSILDYSIAVDAGTVYVAYTVDGGGTNSDSEVMLTTRRPGGPFSPGQVTTRRKDNSCTRYNVSLAARGDGSGHLGLAYTDGVFCNGTSAPSPHMLTGGPGHWIDTDLAYLGLPAGSICQDTGLTMAPDATGHPLYRLILGCSRDDRDSTPHAFFALSETFDAGPLVSLVARAVAVTGAAGHTAAPPSVLLSWHPSADPIPGGHDPRYQIQAMKGGGTWSIIAATNKLSTTFLPPTSGHATYHFRVRLSDRVDDDGIRDWGRWSAVQSLAL